MHYNPIFTLISCLSFLIPQHQVGVFLVPENCFLSKSEGKLILSKSYPMCLSNLLIAGIFMNFGFCLFPNVGFLLYFVLQIVNETDSYLQKQFINA